MINVEKNNEPLDLSYLKEMSGDSAEFIIEMIDLFKSQTPVYISELEQAMGEKNWGKVASCAHRMKPTFAYIGREDVKEHMQMMESNAGALKDLEMIPSAFSELTALMEILYGQLDQARENLEKQL